MTCYLTDSGKAVHQQQQQHVIAPHPLTASLLLYKDIYHVDTSQQPNRTPNPAQSIIKTSQE